MRRVECGKSRRWQHCNSYCHEYRSKAGPELPLGARSRVVGLVEQKAQDFDCCVITALCHREPVSPSKIQHACIRSKDLDVHSLEPTISRALNQSGHQPVCHPGSLPRVRDNNRHLTAIPVSLNVEAARGYRDLGAVLVCHDDEMAAYRRVRIAQPGYLLLGESNVTMTEAEVSRSK